MEISVITPTYYRHKEIPGLFESLQNQTVLPDELILVDGTPPDELRTKEWVEQNAYRFSFKVHYFKESGGTAIQRNFGIEHAKGRYVAFFDDDVRPHSRFLEEIVKHFRSDKEKKIGGITGFKTSHSFDMFSTTRWVWYRRLKLLTTFVPGAYDRKCGYPINAGAQPVFSGVRNVDIMTGACTVYRNSIFKEDGLKFDHFFRDYGVLEDAHLALSVKMSGYANLQCGDAQCIELNSSSGRSNDFIISQKTCLNYYFVFQSIYGPLSLLQRFRFFRYQLFELIRYFGALLSKRNRSSLFALSGKFSGIIITLLFWQSHLKKVMSNK